MMKFLGNSWPKEHTQLSVLIACNLQGHLPNSVGQTCGGQEPKTNANFLAGFCCKTKFGQ
jgi:hypothetical protein